MLPSTLFTLKVDTYEFNPKRRVAYPGALQSDLRRQGFSKGELRRAGLTKRICIDQGSTRIVVWTLPDPIAESESVDGA